MPSVWVAFEWLLGTSLQAAALVCLILLLQSLVGKRLTARWRWAMWSILFARLLMPWDVQSPLSVFNLTSRAMHVRAAQAPVAAVTPAPTTIPDAPPQAVAFAPLLAPQEATHPDWSAVVLLVWLVCTLFLATTTLVNGILLKRRISRRRLVTDSGVLGILEECKDALHVRTVVGVVESPLVVSPALFGVLGPRIVLPEGTINTMSAENLRFIFMHELAHLRRHDIALNWLASALQFIHWFNPFVWYGFYRMRCDRELACDSLVLSRVQPGDAEGYVETLIRFLKGSNRPRVFAGMVGILEGRSQLRRRIMMIARFRPGSYRWSFLAAALVALLALTTLTNAQGEKSQAEQYREALKNEVAVKVDKSPDGDRLTVQYAVIAVCEAAHVPYQWEKSQRLGGDGARKYIAPVEVKNEPANKAIADIAAQAGLAFLVDDDGVYLLTKTTAEYNEALKKKVTVKVDKSPDGDGLTVQYAVMAVCKAAHVPYQWEKSQQLGGNSVRKYIAPVNVVDTPAHKAVTDILTPVGLVFKVDKNGLYLRKPDKPGEKDAK